MFRFCYNNVHFVPYSIYRHIYYITTDLLNEFHWNQLIGPMISLYISGFIYIEVLLSVNQLERYEDKRPYFLLHPFVLNKATVTVAPNMTTTSKIPGIYKLPYWSIDDVDTTLKCPKLQDIGWEWMPIKTFKSSILTRSIHVFLIIYNIENSPLE